MRPLRQIVCLLLVSAFLAQPSLAQAPAPPVAEQLPPPLAATAPPAGVQPTTAPSPPASPESRPAAASVRGDKASSPQAQRAHLQRDLSPWSMFLAADILVKAVIISLGFASLVTWTILFAKSLLLSLAVRRLRKVLSRITETKTMAQAQAAVGAKKSVLSALLAAALQEVRLSSECATDDGIKERAASRFAEITRAEARAMRQGMAVLATIGATAPFVGLFGTVWGIMNSFIGISKAQTTNLAVVAPGIAEALLATAVGLIAAIPAVMIYNHFSRATKSYLELVRRASGNVERLLSRDLDRVRGHLLTLAAE